MPPSPTPFAPGTVATPLSAGVPDAFGLVVALYQSNARLFAELDAVRRETARARAYRAMPGSNRVLADARLLRLRSRRSAALAHLRANRIQARSLLARLDAVPECA